MKMQCSFSELLFVVLKLIVSLILPLKFINSILMKSLDTYSHPFFYSSVLPEVESRKIN